MARKRYVVVCTVWLRKKDWRLRALLNALVGADVLAKDRERDLDVSLQIPQPHSVKDGRVWAEQTAKLLRETCGRFVVGPQAFEDGVEE